MDFEEAGRRVKWAAALCFALYGGWWLLQDRLMANALRQAELEGERPRANTVLSPDGREIEMPARLEAVNAAAAKDPGAALEKLREILAAPASPDKSTWRSGACRACCSTPTAGPATPATGPARRRCSRNSPPFRPIPRSAAFTAETSFFG